MCLGIWGVMFCGTARGGGENGGGCELVNVLLVHLRAKCR